NTLCWLAFLCLYGYFLFCRGGTSVLSHSSTLSITDNIHQCIPAYPSAPAAHHVKGSVGISNPGVLSVMEPSTPLAWLAASSACAASLISNAQYKRSVQPNWEAVVSPGNKPAKVSTRNTLQITFFVAMDDASAVLISVSPIMLTNVCVRSLVVCASRV
ncbi:unnamed protein product, partial [Meganyctiphanes norvegica]